MNNPQKLWFKRKIYGWGWTPSTWEGWAVLIIYLILMLLLGSTIDENSSRREVAFMFIIPGVILTTTLLRICYKRGEMPRWQWGKDLGDS